MNPKRLVTAGLTLLAIASAIRALRSPNVLGDLVPPSRDVGDRLRACGKTRQCTELGSAVPNWEQGAHLLLTSCTRTDGDEIGLRGWWGSVDAAAPGFSFTTSVRQDQVFPLKDGMAELMFCSVLNRDYRGVPLRVSADLELPNGFGWALPAPGNVFVPFRGDATIQGDARASATLEDDVDAGRRLSVTVRVDRPGERPETYPHLRAGSRFDWGVRPAKIVRILEPRAAVLAGWIEVALPDAAEAAGTDRR